MNQAPKLIRQMSNDPRVAAGARREAEAVLAKWMEVVAAGPGGRASHRGANTARPGQRVQVAVHTSTQDIVNLNTVTTCITTFDNTQTYQPKNSTNQFGIIKNECLNVKDVMVNSNSDNSNGNSDDDKPIKLLQGMANELSETLKKEVKEEVNMDLNKSVAKKIKELKENKEKDKSINEKNKKDKERERKRDDYRRKEKREKLREKEKLKEKEKKEKKRESKPFRETEMRNNLDSTEKQRIKELAKKMKEEAENKKGDYKPPSLTASLPKIPKIPKKEETKEKKPSFEELMFAIDTKTKPTVKAPPIKNKNKDLMESITNSMTSKPTQKSSLENKKNKPDRTAVLLSMKTEDKSKQIIKTESIPKANQEEKFKKELQIVEKEDKYDVEEKAATKRPAGDIDFKIKVKPTAQLVESPIFGDFLSTIIPEAPKKKKIKLSELKAQKEAKEKESETIQESDAHETSNQSNKTFSFYGEGSSSPEREENDDSPSPKPEDKEKPDEEMPSVETEGEQQAREVRGILVLARGPKRTRRIQWRPEAELVAVEFFELDETERVNVNKLKFEEQRKRELELERSARQRGARVPEEERGMPWPGLEQLALTCELPDIEYGGNSQERNEQQLREKAVLSALFFNKLPNDPGEPDSPGLTKLDCRPIPLEDTSGEGDNMMDYSGLEWPASVQDPALPSPDPEFDVLKTVDPGPEPSVPTPVVDPDLYAAQKAAMEALSRQGDLGVSLPRDQNIPPPGFQAEQRRAFPGPPQQQQDFQLFQQNNWHNNDSWGPIRGGGPLRGPGRGRGDHNHGFNRGFHNNSNNNQRCPPSNFRQNGGSGGGGFQERQREFPGGRHREYKRPCKFWMEKGFCREENRCKFPHPS